MTKEEELGKSKRLTEIFEVRGVSEEKKSPSVADIMRDEVERHKAEFEKLSLEKIIEERKREIEDLRSGKPRGTDAQQAQARGSPVTELVTSLIALGKTPEEVNQYVTALTPEALSAISAGSSNNPNLGMMVWAMSNRNPQQLQAKDVLEIAQIMKGPQAQQVNPIELVQAVAGIMKVSAPPSGGEVTGVLKDMVIPLIKEMAQSRTSSLESKIASLEEEVKKRPGFAEELTQKKTEIQALKELMGGGEGGSAETTIKLKEMDYAHERYRDEREWEVRKFEMEHGLKEKRWTSVIKDLIGPAIKRATPLLEELVQGGQQVVRQQVQVKSPTISQVVMPPQVVAQPPISKPVPVSRPTSTLPPAPKGKVKDMTSPLSSELPKIASPVVLPVTPEVREEAVPTPQQGTILTCESCGEAIIVPEPRPQRIVCPNSKCETVYELEPEES